MSERYSRIFSLPENLYTEGSPVLIMAGALLKDNETSWLIGQLKLQNISNRTIKMVKVALTCLDAVGRPLGDAVVQEYLDLHAMRGNEFGAKMPIKISNSTTRSYTVRVIEVGFVDNAVWSDSENKWASIPKQQSITEILNDSNVLEGYRSVFGSHADYKVLEYKDLWICTCGAVNHTGETYCYHCNASLKDLQSLNKEELRNKGIWNVAIQLYETNDVVSIEKAKKMFQSVSGDENATKYAQLCEEKIQAIKDRKSKVNAKRNKIVKLISIISAAMIVLGSFAYFVAYPLIAKANGDYKVIIDMYNIKEFEVPEGTKEIKSDAFFGCRSLTSVTIPDSVTHIGNCAFKWSRLTSVTIGSGVTSIGKSAFDCSDLKNIYIKDIAAWCNISFEDMYANPIIKAEKLYLNGELITDLVIPDGVTKIRESAFKELDHLTSVTIPDSVTNIEWGAFYECNNLTSVYIEDMTAWCNISFETLTANPLYYANNLYLNGELVTNLIIPEGITSIGDYTFENCDSLTSVTIPDSVTSIGEGAFSSCNHLTNITIPDSVTSIGEEAFYWCTGLTSITIPNSVTDIGDRAFVNCENLKRIDYTGTIAEWKALLAKCEYIGFATVYCIDGTTKSYR